MSDYQPTDEQLTALGLELTALEEDGRSTYWVAKPLAESAPFQAIIHAAQAEALRAFRQTAIAHQLETYAVVLPDVDIILDALDEAADELDPKPEPCPYNFAHTRHWCGRDTCRES